MIKKWEIWEMCFSLEKSEAGLFLTAKKEKNHEMVQINDLSGNGLLCH